MAHRFKSRCGISANNTTPFIPEFHEAHWRPAQRSKISRIPHLKAAHGVREVTHLRLYGGGYILIALLLFTCTLSTFAQEKSAKTRYVNLGVGYSIPKFLDNSFSTRRYQGRAGSVNAGVYWATPDTTVHHHFTVRFDYGLMSAFAFEFADVNAFRFEGNYQYERYAGSFLNNRVRWYAGGAFNSLWTLWQFENFSNNSLDNSFYFSLSPTTSLEYPFELWKRKFRVTWSAFLPLLTVAVRPSYGTTRFSGFLDDDRDEGVQQFLESTQIVTLNRYFRYSNTLALEYYLKNNNRLRLGYTWNYQRYDEPRLVQSASHNISISTMFNF